MRLLPAPIPVRTWGDFLQAARVGRNPLQPLEVVANRATMSAGRTYRVSLIAESCRPWFKDSTAFAAGPAKAPLQTHRLRQLSKIKRRGPTGRKSLLC